MRISLVNLLLGLSLSYNLADEALIRLVELVPQLNLRASFLLFLVPTRKWQDTLGGLATPADQLLLLCQNQSCSYRSPDGQRNACLGPPILSLGLHTSAYIAILFPEHRCPYTFRLSKDLPVC